MLFRQLSHKIGIKDGGREVDGKMAKDKAPEGGIAEVVSSASVNEKKKIVRALRAALMEKNRCI